MGVSCELEEFSKLIGDFVGDIVVGFGGGEMRVLRIWMFFGG